MNITVLPKVVIKSVNASTDLIVVSDCDTRFQYTIDGENWISPEEDDEGDLICRFTSCGGEAIKSGYYYTATARYGNGENTYGTASRRVKTPSTSDDVNSEDLYEFTIYEGQTISLRNLLGSKIAHLKSCVNVLGYTIPAGETRHISISGNDVTGLSIGSNTATLSCSTRGCAVWGTRTWNALKVKINVIANPDDPTSGFDPTTTEYEFTIYKGDTKRLAELLNAEIAHLRCCVNFSSVNCTSTGRYVTKSGSGKNVTVYGNQIGSDTYTVTCSTRGCAIWGTRTWTGIKVKVNVIERDLIKPGSSKQPDTTVHEITVREGETKKVAALLNDKIAHFTNCVRFDGYTFTEGTQGENLRLGGSGNAMTVTGIYEGESTVAMNCWTRWCAVWGTRTWTGLEIHFTVIPWVQIKSVTTG